MSSRPEQAVIVIPGLGDGVERMTRLTRGWRSRGLDVIVFSMQWYDGQAYRLKEEALIDEANRLKDDYDKVSVVGVSAGGSVAFNLIACLPFIYKVVNNCGRLRPGNQKGFRSFASRTASSSKFAESVEAFVKREKYLSSDQLERMMTVRPRWGDELVPADTCVLEGARNITVPLIEHGITIAYAMVSGVVTGFLAE